MTSRLRAMTNTYSAKSWDEQIVSGAQEGPRIAHAHVTFEYRGLLDGTSTCEMLLYYAGAGYDNSGLTSPGYERFEGAVDGRTGSFIARHEVSYDARGIHDSWTVVPGSATGELTGLTGTGSASAAMGQDTISYTFECTR
jgi:hypothetical protein